jgi:hypothetical protein
MQTLDSSIVPANAAHGGPGDGVLAKCWRVFQALVPGVLLLLVGGCSKDPGMEAIETDANGYFCQKCRAKLFTDRKVFLENCPHCKEDGLVEVVGYRCAKDQHQTLRPKVSGPEGAAVCEQCSAILKNAMFQPHKKDLEAWGATKAGPK